jgi:hypothetical protein
MAKKVNRMSGSAVVLNRAPVESVCAERRYELVRQHLVLPKIFETKSAESVIVNGLDMPARLFASGLVASPGPGG